MKIGNYDLFRTNDGEGIYINHHLVDDKVGAENYWRGWDYWVDLLSKNETYDYKSRCELIRRIRKNR